MRSIFRLLGRMGLVIILLSSAFMHLNHPEKFTPLYHIAYSPLT